jgi:hypothetical protein
MTAAINSKPWRILKARASIRKPGVSWFNAVTRALLTIEIKDSMGGPARIERPNADGRGWAIFLPLTNPESALDTSILGITNDATEKEFIVAGRKAVLHRYGDTDLEWTATTTTITYADLGAGNHTIYLTFDPDTPSTATITDDDTDPVDRLYEVNVASIGGELFGSVVRVYFPGDVPIWPLFGDHPVEELTTTTTT